MDDGQIVRGIINGDEAVVEYVINKYSKLMWRIAATVLYSIASAEDLEECVADVFVYLWQNIGKYDRQRGSLKTWLSTVTKSKAINMYRKLSKNNEVSLNDDIIQNDFALIDDILATETKRELIAAINTLAEPDREIIMRRYYYQQKPKEIGFALDMPVKQVENRLYQSKLKLRKAMHVGMEAERYENS